MRLDAMRISSISPHLATPANLGNPWLTLACLIHWAHSHRLNVLCCTHHHPATPPGTRCGIFRPHAGEGTTGRDRSGSSVGLRPNSMPLMTSNDELQFAISFGCVPTLSRSIITIPTFIDERSGLPVRLLVNKHEGIKPERLSAVIYTRKAHTAEKAS